MSLAHLLSAAVVGPIVVTGAFACALAAALAQLGRRSPAWDGLTHGAPLYLAGGLAALAAAVLLSPAESAPAGVLGALAIVLALLLMAPEVFRGGGPRVATSAQGALKVIQFNAWGGRGGLAPIADWLAAEQPDVVVMPETAPRLLAALAKRTGMTVTHRRGAVAILSREPPLSVPPVGADPALPAWANAVTIRTALGEVAVFGVHYPWPSEWARLVRIPALVATVKAANCGTAILAGDFNSTPWSFTRRSEDRAYGLIRRTRAVFTWPALRGLPFALAPIDHVYAGADWATVEVRRGPWLGSDHYPVVVTLSPRAPS